MRGCERVTERHFVTRSFDYGAPRFGRARSSPSGLIVLTRRRGVELILRLSRGVFLGAEGIYALDARMNEPRWHLARAEVTQLALFSFEAGMIGVRASTDTQIHE